MMFTAVVALCPRRMPSFQSDGSVCVQSCGVAGTISLVCHKDAGVVSATVVVWPDGHK